MLLALGCVATGCSSITQANGNIAFMGDSITALWWLPATNYGISGNTTSQMVARFSREVLGHDYKAVVILGGTNDVRNKSKPIDEEVTTAMVNIENMTEMAEKENLTVVLCRIPPIRSLDDRVEALNDAIESYANAHQLKLVNYYSPMVGHPEYFRDGEHPNDTGYFVMQTALTRVIPLDY